jgi:hypothetical protein
VGSSIGVRFVPRMATRPGTVRQGASGARAHRFVNPD